MTLNIGTTTKVALSNRGQSVFTNNYGAAVVLHMLVDRDTTVAVGKAGTKETSVVTFTQVAEDGESFTLDDGQNDPYTIEYGVDLVAGANATESATALKSFLDTNDAKGFSGVRVGAVVTITNNFYRGGSISKHDDDVDDPNFTITAFSGGVDGPQATRDTSFRLVQDIPEIISVPNGYDVGLWADGGNANCWLTDIKDGAMAYSLGTTTKVTLDGANAATWTNTFTVPVIVRIASSVDFHVKIGDGAVATADNHRTPYAYDIELAVPAGEDISIFAESPGSAWVSDVKHV